MITTLSGSNTILLQRELKKRTAAFIQQHGDLALERLDGEEASFEQIQEALQSLPFLSSMKLVILRLPGFNKQFAEAAQGLLESLPSSTELILVEPKPDKRSSYYKLIKKITDFQDFSELDGRALVNFLVDEAKNHGATISNADVQYLINRVGNNQQQLTNELHKLALYAPQITKASIDALTDAAPQSKVFDLLDAAFAGNHKKALQLYAEQRQQRVEPQAIMGMLVWQLHVLALVVSSGGASSDAVAKDAKLSPYVVSKTASIARRLSPAKVKNLVAELVSIDYASKTKSYNLDEALQNYILTI